MSTTAKARLGIAAVLTVLVGVAATAADHGHAWAQVVVVALMALMLIFGLLVVVDFLAGHRKRGKGGANS
jgi:hypothetical protein